MRVSVSMKGMNSMSMYKCPVCGELFSTSYKKCPFCEEDDLLMDRRKTNSRRSRRNEPRAVGPLLIVIFLMLVALVVFLVAGDSIFSGFGGNDKPVEEEPPVIESPIENDNSPVEEEPEPEKKPMTLDKTSVEMNGGESITLVASEGSGSYAWTSDNEDIVKVENGVLTAVGGGTTTVIVSDGETELSCTVTVKVVPLTLKQSDVSITVGESFTLKYEGGSNFTFTSDNESVAVVGEDGVVTGKGNGKTNITVSNGSDSKSCIVRVK